MHNELHIVIGLGATGLSCVRFLKKQQIPLVVMDTRDAPPNLAAFKETYPEIPVFTGTWPQATLNSAKALVVSPGVAVSHSAIQTAKAHGVEVIGDIELFARVNKTPVIAITGANGKSTVTTLVGEMAKQAGKKVAVIGNIGTPVLDIFDNDFFELDLIVMELSSFQLETTYQLKPLAATVLNITPDHLDRYADFSEYVQAKHRIYHQTQHAIINSQDPLSNSSIIPDSASKWYFGLTSPNQGEFGIRQKQGKMWLCFADEWLVPTQDLKIVGAHNVANALSALALGHAAGLEMSAMLQALKQFEGLAHRCQLVAHKHGVQWINDSKGTNVGACTAAIEGIGQQLSGKIVLLLGGDGKGADFSTLIPLVKQYCRGIIVMGKDAAIILKSLDNIVNAALAQTMEQAVLLANRWAKSGDVVLLSPACSSLDQYQHFAHRGDVYMDCVQQVLGHHAPE
ncbi:MAG: UDP-N-acetylmuramoyl-L-alanine--D-glutamate ligase [Proteobacteria bacterium]|nr:UDP-N-acetylmuramoyl-L-alanine--D-glutamate ligase [Pseudomonadota bacterium]